MRSVKGNTFMFFGDKNVDRVSGLWKVLHITFYVAIAVNAFISSMSAGNMFQTFKYNCILFCSDLTFETETIQTNFAPLDIAEAPENSTRLDDSITNENRTDVFENVTDLIETKSAKRETTANQTIIFKNESHIFFNIEDSIVLMQAKIDVRKSVFASHSYCNFVLGVTLMTFIFATFCIILLAMCSKGGTGSSNNALKKPQNMVYPILFSSLVLGIINFSASLTLKQGIRQFCENFEPFTGQKSCTSLLNNFTLHERQNNFYLPYFILVHTFDLTVVFFACQIIVTFLRIVYAVDYQLYIIEDRLENDESATLNCEERNEKDEAL